MEVRDSYFGTAYVSEIFHSNEVSGFHEQAGRLVNLIYHITGIVKLLSPAIYEELNIFLIQTKEEIVNLPLLKLDLFLEGKKSELNRILQKLAVEDLAEDLPAYPVPKNRKELKTAYQFMLDKVVSCKFRHLIEVLCAQGLLAAFEDENFEDLKCDFILPRRAFSADSSITPDRFQNTLCKAYCEAEYRRMKIICAFSEDKLGISFKNAKYRALSYITQKLIEIGEPEKASEMQFEFEELEKTKALIRENLANHYKSSL